MQVSINWIKRYIDLPDSLSIDRIAYDLTMRTVEVEYVIDTSKKFENIVVGRVLEVKEHPNADALKICMVDIGEGEPVQIVCGGTNLYPGENVIVSKPGAMVVWHGEGEPVKIKETKMRGEKSFGMICASAEVYLGEVFPCDDERIIVDLGDIPCHPGQNISEVVGLNDYVLEIDNKSLTNRPDLWGHYGIARELSAIYDIPLKELPVLKPEEGLPGYKVVIEEPEKCNRYAAIVIDKVDTRQAPLWIKTAIINGGMRPINAIVDITNYVLLAVGQPLHGFDFNHVEGGIIVRNARKGECLELLDEDDIELTEDDLVICDEKEPMALAGIKGGKKDSILPDTSKIVLEIANFTAQTIRKTGKRFDKKTDASIRYEKGIDTYRVDDGISMALSLFKEIFPDCEIKAYGDEYPVKTERAEIEVPKAFLDERLGKSLEDSEIKKTLGNLGYDVEFTDNIYKVKAPVWRSTGDVGIKDDVLGDLARMIGYENFETKPLTMSFTEAVNQRKVSLERSISEYLAFRCGFTQVDTYPWVNDKYIKAAGIDNSDAVKLANPPSPDCATLKTSLIPNLIEAVAGNLRWFDEFRIFEKSQVFRQGEYSPSTAEEVLPVQKLHFAGAYAAQDPKKIFFAVKGVVAEMARYCHMAELTFRHGEKPSWSDDAAYLNIMCGKKQVGSMGLLKVSAMGEAGIKRTNVAMFEIDFTELEPLESRTNVFEHLPQFPLVEGDLSIIVDEGVKWADIAESIKYMVKDLRFIEEYRGKQIPEGKKSVMLRFWIGSDNSTMNAKQIEKKTNGIIKQLQNKVKAEVRSE